METVASDRHIASPGKNGSSVIGNGGGKCCSRAVTGERVLRSSTTPQRMIAMQLDIFAVVIVVDDGALNSNILGGKLLIAAMRIARCWILTVKVDLR